MFIRVRGGWVDSEALRYEVDGRRGRLTEREGAILDFLAGAQGEPCHRDDLTRNVLEYSPKVQTRALDIAVLRLRKKIELDPSNPVHLITVSGVGYALVPEKEPVSSDTLDIAGMVAKVLSKDDSWSEVGPHDQQMVAAMSLFSAPIGPLVLGQLFGPDADARVEALVRKGLLKRAGEGVGVARTVRGHARDAASEQVREQVLDWAVDAAEHLRSQWPVGDDHEYFAHADAMVGLAHTQAPARRVVIETGFIGYASKVTLHQLEDLDAASRDLSTELRGRALTALLANITTGEPHLAAWAAELDSLLPELDHEDQISALLRLSAEATMIRRDRERAERILHTAIDALDNRTRPALAASVWLCKGAFGISDRYQAYENATGFARLAGSPTLGALAVSGMASSSPSLTEDTLKLLNLAVDMAAQGAACLHARSLVSLARATMMLDIEQAVPLSIDALRVARTCGLPERVALALAVRSDLERVQGDPSRALQTIDEARSTITTAVIELDLRRVGILAELGRLDEARDLLESIPEERSANEELLHVMARASLARATEGDEAARALMAEVDDQGLTSTVLLQMELIPMLHQGLWRLPE